MRVQNVTDRIEAMERLDGGDRTALALLSVPLGPVPERREPLDPEAAERVADHLDVARVELRQAMKRLHLERGAEGAADLHLRVGLLALDIDDLLALLAERHAS